MTAREIPQPAPSDHSDAAALVCPNCGYDLRGIDSGRCPECGAGFDRQSLTVSQLPWVHRRQIGGFRGYWRTVWLSTADPRRLAREITRPVSYRDAWRFRLITSMLGAAPVMAVLGIALWYALPILKNAAGSLLTAPLNGLTGPALPLWDLWLPAVAGMMLWPILPIAVFLLVLGMTGIPSYWFHPRAVPLEQQNRAVALSRYLGAPLSLSFLPTACLATAVWMAATDRAENRTGFQVFALLDVVGAVTLLALPGLIWWNTLKLLRRTVQPSGWRVLSAAVGVPVGWVVLGALCVFGVPWIAGYVALFADSLRA